MPYKFVRGQYVAGTWAKVDLHVLLTLHTIFYIDVTELNVISPTVLMMTESSNGIQLQNVELSDLYAFLLPRA